MATAMAIVRQEVVEQLAGLFHRNGYVRRQNPERVKTGGREYKKGDEVRLVANSWEELRTIRRLLRIAGFKPARPFVKVNQWRQPIYGREEVTKFLALVGEQPDASSTNESPPGEKAHVDTGGVAAGRPIHRTAR